MKPCFPSTVIAHPHTAGPHVSRRHVATCALAIVLMAGWASIFAADTSGTATTKRNNVSNGSSTVTGRERGQN